MMVWKRFINPCAVVALVCGLAQTAFAEDMNVPTEGWIVGPIPAEGAGISYCSMKNTYPDGQMLVFARDSAGSNSIAIDFHKDLFEVGRQSDADIHVGVVRRQAATLAATRQVVVMQMGTDNVFYNALRNKRNISFIIKRNVGLKIGSKQYSFDLNASITDALNALDDCSSSLKSGSGYTQGTIPLKDKTAEPEETPQADAEIEEQAAPEEEETPAPAPKKKTSKASEDKSSLKSDIDRLHAENEKLADENRKMAEGTTAPPAVPLSSLQPSAALKGLLEAARVAPPETIETQSGVYKWTYGDIYGSAQALAKAPGKGFSETAGSYVHKASALCHGQFAQKTGKVKRAGKYSVIESEMTCLDGENDAAAAVLFMADQDNVSVITQEGTVDQLSTALFLRDQIVSAASGKSID